MILTGEAFGRQLGLDAIMKVGPLMKPVVAFHKEEARAVTRVVSCHVVMQSKDPHLMPLGKMFTPFL